MTKTTEPTRVISTPTLSLYPIQSATLICLSTKELPSSRRSQPCGYDDLISEEQRIVETDHMRELSDEKARELNQHIQKLVELTEDSQHPTVSITYYEPDGRKAGGQYIEITDAVKRVDGVNWVIELVIMEGFLNKTVAIDRLAGLRLSEDHMDHFIAAQLYRGIVFRSYTHSRYVRMNFFSSTPSSNTYFRKISAHA